MASTKAKLVPLRTRAELLAQDEMINVYIAEIPKKRASMVLNAIRSIPGQTDIPLQHLRRFARASSLPEHVLALTSTTSSCCMNTELGERLDGEETVTKVDAQEIMHVLLCPTNLIEHAKLTALIQSTLDGFRPIKIVETTVPLHAPTSLDRAAAASATYWPTIFMNGNPFGPHPSIVARAQTDMQDDAAWLMKTAGCVGAEAQHRGFGCGCGVVVVERSLESNAAEIVAAAGDGRWVGLSETRGAGNAGGHAVLRAIALVAKKRRSMAASTRLNGDSSGKVFCGEPLTPLEKHYFENSKLRANGYLCLGLEFWVTHEPCTMCSMALLHSRVNRIIFGQRMPRTGAMMVQGIDINARKDGVNGRGNSVGVKQLGPGDCGLEYGLFWRDDLNWRFMCWHWQSEDDELRAKNNNTMVEADTQV